MLLHFRESETGPSLVLSGAAAIEGLDLRDSSGARVVSFDRAVVKITELAPLDRVVYLHKITLTGMKANLARSHDGAINVAMLLRTDPSQRPAPASNPTAAASPQASSVESRRLDAALESIKVIDSSVTVTDQSTAAGASATFENISFGASDLRLKGAAPAHFDLATKLNSGGAVAIKGSVDLSQSQLAAEVKLEHVNIPPLQAFVQTPFAGTIISGAITAHGGVKSSFASDKLELRAESADVAIDNLSVQAPARVEQHPPRNASPLDNQPPIGWSHVAVSINSFDLAQRQIDIKEVRADGIKLIARRSKRRGLNLTTLLKQPSPATPGGNPAPIAAIGNTQETQAKAPPWRYRVESVAIENADALFEDRLARGRRIQAEFSPLNIHMKGVSDDLARPVPIEIDGVRNKVGTFKVEGTASLQPIKADLHVETKTLALAGVDAYVSTRLNAEIRRAALTLKGDVGVAQVNTDFHVNYRGDATVGDFTMIDKVTGDDFLDWRSLSLSAVDAAFGDGPPKFHVDAVAVSDFYSRLILNSSGTLNLKDIVATQSERPKSLTRTEGEPGGAVPNAAPTVAPPSKIEADVLVKNVTLKDGSVDYSDDFIQPHFSATLTDIAGSVGAFGTTTREPAAIELQGHVNGSAPLNVSGSISPLTPKAFVDIRAKAEDIELTGLSPYSTKYTGFPIVKGTLSADVHYLLNQGELKADNDIFLDQLTFGDKVETKSIVNLPLRFAVAVLKNSRRDRLRIPVSDRCRIRISASAP